MAGVTCANYLRYADSVAYYDQQLESLRNCVDIHRDLTSMVDVSRNAIEVKQFEGLFKQVLSTANLEYVHYRINAVGGFIEPDATLFRISVIEKTPISPGQFVRFCQQFNKEFRENGYSFYGINSVKLSLDAAGVSGENRWQCDQLILSFIGKTDKNRR